MSAPIKLQAENRVGVEPDASEGSPEALVRYLQYAPLERTIYGPKMTDLRRFRRDYPFYKTQAHSLRFEA